MPRLNGPRQRSLPHWLEKVCRPNPVNGCCFISTFLDPIFLVLYRELYYRHVYSRLSPNVDDRFHSYENSCELFNFLLSLSGLCAPLIYIDQDVIRFGWTCQSGASRYLALGYC